MEKGPGAQKTFLAFSASSQAINRTLPYAPMFEKSNANSWVCVRTVLTYNVL